MKKNLRKLFLLMAVIMTAVVCLAFEVGALEATGQCGDNVYWTFNNKTGELVISGSGEMYDKNGQSPFYYNTDIKSIVIHNGITSIGSGAFSGCSNLVSVTIPNSVKEINRMAFRYCPKLKSIIVPDSVTSIGSAAFMSCSSLENITIGNNLKSMGEGPFDNTAYYNNQLNWDNDALYIGKYLIGANEDISGEYIVKEGTKLVAGSVFANCTKLKNIVIPDSVTGIGDWAFYNCLNLSDISIPYGVTSLGEYAFSGCKNLTNISIHGGITNIKDFTFSDCTGLTSIIISDGVKSIGYCAFAHCTSLRKVTIPKSVTNVGEMAFYDCQDIKEVYYNGSRKQWSNIYFDWDNNDLLDATIHYTGEPQCTHTNKTTTTKATLKKNGKVVTKCTVCGEVKSSKTIYYPKTIKLSETNYTYNGKAKKPTVTVKDSKGKTLKKGTDYTVKYASGRKNPGKYTVTVTFMGKYSGTKKLTLTIKPKAPSISSLYSKTKGKAVIKWANVTGESGYQVYYATSKNGTYKKLDSYKANKTSATAKKLKSGKKYYFKVRAYKKTSSGTVYSSWSSVKSVKIK